MNKVIEFILCVIVVLAMVTGVLALFGFLMADFTMVPVMLVCLIVTIVANKTLIHMVEKQVDVKGY